jgi:hypothetical protein
MLADHPRRAVQPGPLAVRPAEAQRFQEAVERGLGAQARKQLAEVPGKKVALAGQVNPDSGDGVLVGVINQQVSQQLPDPGRGRVSTGESSS